MCEPFDLLKYVQKGLKKNTKRSPLDDKPGLSAIAKKAGVGYKWMSMIIHGHGVPTWDVLSRLWQVVHQLEQGAKVEDVKIKKLK